jgi:uncharacterized caspase-like protein
MANRALLVGINAYPDQPLYGCVNDAKDVAQFLTEKCGFAASDIHMLIDAEATAAKIREALEQWLLQGAAAGDRLLFHYSGHGSILPGADGAVHDVICPVDFDFTAAHSLSDEDFRKIFAAVPGGVEFNWISDSCHSGDLARGWRRVTRALGMGRVRARFLRPPPALMAEIVELRKKQAQRRSLSRALDRLNGALIAGCQSDETSADATIDDRANGALTYYLLKELRSPDGLSRDIHTLVGNVATTVANSGYDQHPQVRGLEAVCLRPFLALQAGTRAVPAAQPDDAVSARASGVPRGTRGKRGGRLAFVVGNGSYVDANSLRNAENDAREIGRRLVKLGFSVFGSVGGIDEEVPFGKNLTRRAMEASFEQFRRQIAPGDTVLIYYAGHGLQIDDQNYLVPSDARIDGDDPLASLVALRPLIERAAFAAKSGGTVLVFLDSCRENPFSKEQLLHLAKMAQPSTGGAAAEGFTVVDQGFATVKLAAKDDAARTFIAFSTAPGDFAYDGSGEHSPFAAALLDHVSTRGLPLTELFDRVCRDVVDRAKHEQHFQDPWHESNLDVDHRFLFSPLTWRPVVELFVLGALAGLITCVLLFRQEDRLQRVRLGDPQAEPWLWGAGLIFALVVAIGILRWGSRRWRDVVLAVLGTAASFAVALTILKAHKRQDWTYADLPSLQSAVSQAILDYPVLVLSAIAGILFALGMLAAYRPRRAVYRWAIWLGAIGLGALSATGLASVQIVASRQSELFVAVSLLCVFAGAVFTAGTALACKPQRGKFHGFGVATGAVCVGLLMPFFFAIFVYALQHNQGLAAHKEAALMYGLGALWFALFGAQLGFCFRYYVPEHRRWSPGAKP